MGLRRLAGCQWQLKSVKSIHAFYVALVCLRQATLTKGLIVFLQSFDHRVNQIASSGNV